MRSVLLALLAIGLGCSLVLPIAIVADSDYYPMLLIIAVVSLGVFVLILDREL